MDNEIISADSMNLHTQSVAGLATQLGYDGDLTVGSLEDGIRLYQRRTIEDLFELGKRLLLLKEQCQHGEFQNRVELLGFDPSLARRLMTATLKFAKQETSPVLKTVKTQSKLLELIVLDDEEIQVIADGGSVGDVNLDSIETMSVRELKKALREAKEENQKLKDSDQAKDLILQKKDQKLNELDTKLTKLESPVEVAKRAETEDQQIEKAAMETLSTESHMLLNAVMRFNNAINGVLDVANEKHIGQLYERVDETVIASYQRIATFTQTLGVQVDFENMVSPEWLFPQAEKTAQTEDE